MKELCKFPDEGEAHRIITGLRWIGLFSDAKATIRDGNLLDTLCAQLETLMAYESGERAARVHAMALCAPGHSSRHSSTCAPACMLMQPPTQPPACKPPPRLPISRLLAWVAASVVTNQL